jgi:hypothetical protein
VRERCRHHDEGLSRIQRADCAWLVIAALGYFLSTAKGSGKG